MNVLTTSFSVFYFLLMLSQAFRPNCPPNFPKSPTNLPRNAKNVAYQKITITKHLINASKETLGPLLIKERLMRPIVSIFPFPKINVRQCNP